jgi:hypothetical protein
MTQLMDSQSRRRMREAVVPFLHQWAHTQLSQDQCCYGCQACESNDTRRLCVSNSVTLPRDVRALDDSSSSSSANLSTSACSSTTSSTCSSNGGRDESTSSKAIYDAIIPSPWPSKSARYSTIIPLDTVVRQSDENSAFSPVYLAHIDFDRRNMRQLFHDFQDTWKPSFERHLGPLSLEEFLGKSSEVVEMVNLWFLLSDFQPSISLALLDRSAVDRDDSRRVPYTAVRRDKSHFTAIAVTPSEQDVWTTFEDMRVGEVIIFQTLRVPHSAIRLTEEANYRRSCEIRCVFLK